MVNVYCQLDWIYNPQGTISLGLSKGASGKAVMVTLSQGGSQGDQGGEGELSSSIFSLCCLTAHVAWSESLPPPPPWLLQCEGRDPRQSVKADRYHKYRVREVGSGTVFSPSHSAFLGCDPSHSSWSPRSHFVWKYFRPQALLYYVHELYKWMIKTCSRKSFSTTPQSWVGN